MEPLFHLAEVMVSLMGQVPILFAYLVGLFLARRYRQLYPAPCRWLAAGCVLHLLTTIG